MTKATVCGVPVVIYDFTPIYKDESHSAINVYFPCYGKQLPTLTSLITLEFITDAQE
jgi:hypothetical protein